MQNIRNEFIQWFKWCVDQNKMEINRMRHTPRHTHRICDGI